MSIDRAVEVDADGRVNLAHLAPCCKHRRLLPSEQLFKRLYQPRQ